MPTFKDRREAGQQLASALVSPSASGDIIILALPRGGVPVAFEVALRLSAPLDVFLVRKLGSPKRAELALGAIASDGIQVMNDKLVRHLGIQEAEITTICERELLELQRRERCYRGDRAFPRVTGRTVILVDDGAATGATMRAAVTALRQQHPSKIVVGVPVASREALEVLRGEADEVVGVFVPERFFGVGRWYEDFAQTGDEEVVNLLERASRRWPN